MIKQKIAMFRNNQGVDSLMYQVNYWIKQMEVEWKDKFVIKSISQTASFNVLAFSILYTIEE